MLRKSLSCLRSRVRGLASGSSGSSHAGKVKSPVTAALWNLRKEQASEHAVQQQQQQQQGGAHRDHTQGQSSSSMGGVAAPGFLVHKAPAASAVDVVYNFSSDKELAFRYSNAFGFVRMGTVLGE